MKRNLRLLLSLTSILIFGAACWQTPTEPNQSAAAVENTGNQTVANANITKGAILESSQNAADAPYDLQFLDTMTAHHQNAVEMAKSVAAKSENAALKAFAAKIVGNRTGEIAQMKAWREKWFAGKPAAINTEMPGMSDSVRGINLKKLEANGGKQLDLRFLEIMTRHQEGALTTAKEASEKAEHAEIKKLASRIIKTEEAEVKQMQAWNQAWSN